MDPMNPEHVANVVAYLACPAATWLSGQVFEVAGTNVRRWVPWSPAAEADRYDDRPVVHVRRAPAQANLLVRATADDPLPGTNLVRLIGTKDRVTLQ